MRIIFFGTPEFAVKSLNALIEAGKEVVSVVTRPDRAKGRGHKLSQPPVKQYALSRGLSVIQPQDIKSPAFIGKLAELHPELAVVVAYGKIIPPAILNLPLRGCVNVHASLLPKYRGAAPIQHAIINGEMMTGVTIMLMDEGLDTGAILLRQEIEISEDDNAFTLGKRLAETGASLLLKTVSGLKKGSIKPLPQTGEASYAPPLRKDDGRINWSLPAKMISNLIRGTYPWPGAYCYINKERIVVLKAKPVQTGNQAVPGKIEDTSDSCYVGTGSGLLSLLEVRPDGKKAMSGSAFVNGRRLKKGMSFEPV